MKYCPVCKIEYADSAEYCKKCEAYLMDKMPEPKNVKTDFKRLFKMSLYTLGFIVFVMLLYNLFALLMK